MDHPHATSEKEMIAMADEELARLHRQLRIMEEDRNAFAEETTIKLKKQRKIIKTLAEEKQRLIEDLNVADCKAHKRKDQEISANVQKLLLKYRECCRVVQEEKEEMVELNIQIKKLESDIKKQRPKSTVTEREYSSHLQYGARAVKSLQNRLDTSIKKFCNILTENKRLREDIDHLLKERANFNKTYESLIAQLNQGKRYMVDLIEQATVAYDQREEWCSKLAALKKRAAREYETHTEEMRDIQRKLDHDYNLKEFLGVKGQKRVLKDLEEKEKKKKELQAQSLENQLERYEEILSKIQEFCHEQDVERITSQFVKQEEENFALFNYVNELNHEIELLNDAISQLTATLDEQQELNNERAKERNETLESLQKSLEDAKAEADMNETFLKESQDALRQILEGIEAIFNTLKCDKGTILRLLGDNVEISSFNVMIYMGVIEKKISDVITFIYFSEKSLHGPGKKVHV